jgi:hypothetical protein
MPKRLDASKIFPDPTRIPGFIDKLVNIYKPK